MPLMKTRRVQTIDGQLASVINVKTSDVNEFLPFAWAQFGTRAPIPHVAAVLCDPECADQELRNVEHLNKKVAAFKRGGNTFGEKARRTQQAGVLALIIINSDNELFAVLDTCAEPGNDSASPVIIPVVLVAADAGATLLQENVTPSRLLQLTGILRP
jgi:hypothetical protein